MFYSLQKNHGIKPNRHIWLQEDSNLQTFTQTIWPSCLNSWVYFHEKSGGGFEFHCIRLIFIYRECFDKELLDIQAITESSQVYQTFASVFTNRKTWMVLRLLKKYEVGTSSNESRKTCKIEWWCHFSFLLVST